MLGHMEQGRLVLEEIYRFDNVQVYKNGHDCWNIENIYEYILHGLKVCARIGKMVGIDTWGVDYVLLDKERQPCCDCVSYRDRRTEGMDDKVSAKISPEELYQRTGIQKQLFNTIYQMTAQRQESEGELFRAEHFLMIPEYLNFLLTGRIVNEYTNATTTSLVNAETKSWDYELIEMLGFPKKIFGELAMPGTVIGGFTEEVQKNVGFNSTVILPATHDTGSAFLAVPARDECAVYLSSGTWSLLGVENDKPITGRESREQNFTNEGGFQYRFRYLKNIMGLWMIQSIRRELNGVAYVEGRGDRRKKRQHQIGFSELSEAAGRSRYFMSVVDVNDSRFLTPESMTEEIKNACRESAQPVPKDTGELMQCVYRSLSKCYADAVGTLAELTGKTYTSINIVGGGCQDAYLNQMTAELSGLPVYAGPVEGTALGNLMVQMLHEAEFTDLQDARNVIRDSFQITKYQ